MLNYKNNNKGEQLTQSVCVCMYMFVFLLGLFTERDQTLCSTVQSSACKGFWKVVWCAVQGKQVYGVMSDGRQIHVLISQLEYSLSLFFFSKKLECTLKNKYLIEGFMVPIKPGFSKLGQKNRTMIISSEKLTYIFNMYNVVLLTQRELYHWKHFPFGL